MKIVGTIVNKEMTLVGLLLKGKPSELGQGTGTGYLMKPYKLSEVKSLINDGKIKDYKINEKGNIEGINKKLSNLPMYDSKGNFLDKRMEIRSAIEDSGNLVGAVVYFPLMGKEKKLKVDDLSLLYEYFEPINFGLRERDNKYYITGKGDTKKEDIPIIDNTSSPEKTKNSPEKKKPSSQKIKCSPGYTPFIITKENRNIVDYLGVEYGNGDEELEIPKRFEYNGKKYEVVGIADYAFEDNHKLISVKIPDSVTSIGYSAFGGCAKLSSIEIPDSVTSIGAFAFQYCSSLSSIKIPNSVTNLGNSAFFECTSLKLANIPNHITAIPSSLFCSCRELSSIVIPNGVTIIEDGAFAGCRNLVSVEIPNSVTSIEWEAFGYCSELKDIKIPNSVTYIGEAAFAGCASLISVIIPDNVNFIGSSAFSDCKKLTSIVLPRSLVRLGNETAICDSGIFVDSAKLKKIYYKGSKAEWNRILKVKGWSEYMPKDCKIIYNYVGFSDDSSDSSIEIPFEITKENRHLIGYKGIEKEELIIPERFSYDGENYIVRFIGNCAFENCVNLSSVVIPNSVVSISSGAFMGCESLSSIVLPNSITTIPVEMFRECFTLTSIKIPDSVVAIEGYAFCDCTSLSSVLLSKNIQYLDDETFIGCSALKSIVIPESLVQIGGDFNYPNLFNCNTNNGVFLDCNNLKTIYYKGSQSKWLEIKKAKNWKKGLSKDCEIIFNYKG